MEAAPSITVIEGSGPASKPVFSIIARADRKLIRTLDTYEDARRFADGFDAGAAYVRTTKKQGDN